MPMGSNGLLVCAPLPVSGTVRSSSFVVPPPVVNGHGWCSRVDQAPRARNDSPYEIPLVAPQESPDASSAVCCDRSISRTSRGRSGSRGRSRDRARFSLRDSGHCRRTSSCPSKRGPPSAVGSLSPRLHNSTSDTTPQTSSGQSGMSPCSCHYDSQWCGRVRRG